MHDSYKITKCIKNRAKQQGTSQGEMLSECGLGINTISELSKGKQISYANFAKIADYLDCSVDYLFLTINILDIRDNQVPELKKFCKSVFDIDSIFSTASELKYAHEFKNIFTAQLEDPSDDFLRFFLQGCYSGPKTQNVMEKFRPTLKKVLNDLISEMMNDKIKTVFGGSGGSVSISEAKPAEAPAPEPVEDEEPGKRVPNVITTEEELEAYFIIKNLLDDTTDIHNVTYKDTESYFSVLYKGNTRKWICRLRLTENMKYLVVPDEAKKETRYTLKDVYDIRQYKEQLVAVLQRYI